MGPNGNEFVQDWDFNPVFQRAVRRAAVFRLGGLFDGGAAGDLEGEIARLLEDTDLAALYRATVDHTLRSIEMQMQDPELKAFVEADTVDVAAQ